MEATDQNSFNDQRLSDLKRVSSRRSSEPLQRVVMGNETTGVGYSVVWLVNESTLPQYNIGAAVYGESIYLHFSLI